MALTITLPCNLQRPKSVKDAVMHTLVKEHPLSMKKIYFSVKRLGLEVSYQAVHKALKELVNEEVLEKNGVGYEINQRYTETLCDFINKVKNGSFADLTDLPAIIELETVNDVDKFLLDVSEMLITEDKEIKPLRYMFWSHFWVPLFLDSKTYERILSISQKAKVFFLTRCDTPIDRWSSSIWNKSRIIKTNIAPSEDVADFAILGDYIIQIFYPEEIRRGLESVLKSAKSVFDIDINSLYNNMFCKRTKIPLLIMKNRVIADQLKNRVMKYFVNQ